MDTKYFETYKPSFMMNPRAEDLVKLLKVLPEEGVTIVDEIEEYNYGKFGYILNSDGNKMELWKANDKAFLWLGNNYYI